MNNTTMDEEAEYDALTERGRNDEKTGLDASTGGDPSNEEGDETMWTQLLRTEQRRRGNIVGPLGSGGRNNNKGDKSTQ
jgi:hypothetical protein